MRNLIFLCCMLFATMNTFGQQDVITLNGRVLDAESGSPIPGVNVLEKNTSNGNATNFDGEFTIKVKRGAILTFSYIGYERKEVKVTSSELLTVNLKLQMEDLDEVVLVGYGVQKKENLTGAVSTISSDKIENRPVTDVMQAIQGTAPGLQLSVGNQGGEPGASMNISIRGAGNLQGTGAPLVIVDDIPLNNPSDMNDINPEDIESISVLKDAASSAIYGSRAAFGVILIKTKSGEAMDGHKFSYTNNFAYSSPLNLPEMMNSLEFANYFNLAATNGGRGAVFSDEAIERIKAYLADPENTPVTIANPDGTRWQQYSGSNANTDWFDVMYKDMVLRQQHNLSFSGRQKDVNYHVSAAVLDAPGVMSFGDDSYNRYNLNAKLASKMTNWFRFDVNMRLAKIDQERPSYDPGLYLHNIARRWPTNGVIMPNGSYSDGSEIPYIMDGGRRLSESFNSNVGLNLIFEPIKDLKFTTSLLYRNYHTEIQSHNAIVSVTEPNGSERKLRQNSSIWNYASNNTYLSPNFVLSYKKTFSQDHNFNGLLGYQQEENTYRSLSGSKDNLITDNVPAIRTAVGEDYIDATQGTYVTRGYFGRLAYNYKEKYLLEVNGRYDASSRFAEDMRWDFFPSVSVGYNIAKEGFWNVKPISTFKLRYSVGSIGNQNVANYLYIGRMPIRTNLWWLTDEGRPNYTLTPGLISPDITWETVTTDNYGLDISAFSQRLDVTFEIFKRTTEDMFGPAERLPALLGTSAPQSNNASLETKGFDLSVNWKDNIGDLGYNLGFILSDARTTVTEYSNPNNLLNTYRVGQELGEIWGFETVGLYQSQDEIDNGPDQSPVWGGDWKPGDVQYQDLNGDNIIDYGDSTTDSPGDRKIIGNSTPRYTYSITGGLNFKGIDFSMFWQGVGKRDVWTGGPYTFGAVGNLWQSAGLKEHLNYWSEDNPNGFYPRPTFNNTWRNQQVQTRYLQNASYLRLKNVTVGYSFSDSILDRFHMDKLRLYVTAENVVTITKIADIFDPEATGGRWGNGKIYPLQKSIAIGLNVQF
ncbi:TonB-linked outer membrane protein, SusC/RagA family [Zhouia amylolytica]|uniref:TonB-linked outer membrane protein, SusC/RagA family n=1 Tax=Zhouia amylolytica TaxID=376730 RepID=A0A1I6VMJ1_9FLAO|nr:TonB-dependent receptor [Zhouia amylolytica]SFT14831.1 TonB-linked outer membrane protein, SusC/RagA family [Zhouia amylolytica]